SSGHLVLVPEALEWDAPGLTFDVLLHIASLVALLVYFSGDLLDLGRGLLAGDGRARRLLLFLAIGTVPAAVAGVALGEYFEDSFEDAPSAAIQLLFTAAILVIGEQMLTHREKKAAEKGARLRDMEQLNGGDAAAIGVAQAVSILPGISRSGSTIATGLALGISRDDSARFAFLLAIPALFGAALVKIPDFGEASIGLGAGIAGFAASLITSYAAIWGLIKYLKTRTLYPFAAYCIVAGIIFYLLVT
ncbi:MAG TPA: undecaprenyl-diphosphate phosphatase, partial [Actinomycetota bacterium]|nr:undecaprenyl-diphosphate phosphatase [Actinomycetota bacterium]